MNIKVNGENMEAPNGATLAQLVEMLEMNPQLIAAEVNKELVTRSRHAEKILSEGDVVEIVTLVGGG